MHAVSRRDDPLARQHGASAAVLGAVVQAHLPGPAPRGYGCPPNHTRSTGVQPTLCKAAGELVLGKAPAVRPSHWRAREAKKLLHPGGDLRDTGEERDAHLSTSEPQFDPIHSWPCTGTSLW